MKVFIEKKNKRLVKEDIYAAEPIGGAEYIKQTGQEAVLKGFLEKMVSYSGTRYSGAGSMATLAAALPGMAWAKALGDTSKERMATWRSVTSAALLSVDFWLNFYKKVPVQRLKALLDKTAAFQQSRSARQEDPIEYEPEPPMDAPSRGTWARSLDLDQSVKGRPWLHLIKPEHLNRLLLHVFREFIEDNDEKYPISSDVLDALYHEMESGDIASTGIAKILSIYLQTVGKWQLELAKQRSTTKSAPEAEVENGEVPGTGDLQLKNPSGAPSQNLQLNHGDKRLQEIVREEIAKLLKEKRKVK